MVLLLLIAIAAYLSFRFYPVWKAAEYVQKNLDLAHFSYELEVELGREKMQEDQIKGFQILTEVTGLEEEDLYHLTLTGKVWEDTIHVLVYPGGAESPFLELYLGNDTSVINETMLYNSIRNHLAEKIGLLGLVMPEQRETLYMTLEQTEQIFGLDLEGVRNFHLGTVEKKPAVSRYFVLLAAMGREKGTGRSRYTLETEQLELQFEVPEEGSASPLAFRLYAQEPAELTGKYAMIFSQMGFPVNGEQLSVVKNLSVTMVPGGEEISMPTNFVNQNVVELISGIREWVMKLGNGNSGETGNW